jgi:hypothetical protein
MGILYKDSSGITPDPSSNTISCEVPVEQNTSPMFVFRYGKPRRPLTWRSSLPLYLSFSSLSDDIDITRFLSPSTTPNEPPTIQHRDIPSREKPQTTDIPQSLPLTSSALLAAHGEVPSILNSDNTANPIPISSPSTPSLDQLGDWTFINTTPHRTTQIATPSSEPETWIILSDDS